MKTHQFSRKLLKGAFKKYMKPSLQAIKEMQKGGDFKVIITYVDTDKAVDYEADMKLKSREDKPGFDFEISIKDQIKNSGVKYLKSYGLDRELCIYNDDQIFIAESGSVMNFECNFPSLPRKLTGYLNNLRSKNGRFNKSYFRMCIPILNSDIIYPASIFESDIHLVFDVPNWDMQPSLIGIRFPSIKGMCVKLNVSGKHFHFYAIEDVNCVFIDSLERLSYDEFQIITENIRLAFAFLTAKYYSGEVYTLVANDKNFRKISAVAYKFEENSINGKQQLINPTELFSQYSKNPSPEFKERFSDYHKCFPVEIFGFFCSVLSTNLVLRRATEILVSSCSIKDSLQQGILCSVSLETITELITDDNKNVVKPIPDKQIARALIKRLNTVLDEEFKNIPPRGLPMIKSKLADLNKPTNKSKLLFPFHLFRIPLSSKDEEILNYRNDFLHGRSPSNRKEGWELQQIALKLHFLAGILVLKYIGYSGHVMHLPFWNLFNDQERMLEIFPVDNEGLKDLLDKVKLGDSETCDDDFALMETAGQLSLFMDNLIRLI